MVENEKCPSPADRAPPDMVCVILDVISACATRLRQGYGRHTGGPKPRRRGGWSRVAHHLRPGVISRTPIPNFSRTRLDLTDRLTPVSAICMQRWRKPYFQGFAGAASALLIRHP